MNLFYRHKVNDFSHMSQWEKIPDIQFHGSEVLASKIIGNFTRDAVIKHVEKINKIAKDIAHDKGKIGCALHYKDNGWFGGVLTDIGEPMNIFDPEDSSYSGILSTDRINGLQIYFIKTN